jgi:hypothetical protein
MAFLLKNIQIRSVKVVVLRYIIVKAQVKISVWLLLRAMDKFSSGFIENNAIQMGVTTDWKRNVKNCQLL